VLEGCRHAEGFEHMVYASSSSVYGDRPLAGAFKETEAAETPSSLYAATKRANELMSASYSHVYGIPQSGLRFFTVYGPWGRPDMAYFSFARAIMDGTPITLYDNGTLRRDFTFIDDIVSGVLGVLDRPPAGDAPRLLNIGNNRSETVRTLVSLLEEGLGRRAVIQDVPRPAADVTDTFADISAIKALTGFSPKTPLEVGIPRFLEWFKGWNQAR
jgi:UDP-glucuronate 4-epimerase